MLTNMDSKIRIVHLVRNMKLRAGIERVIFNLSNFMDKEKYEIYIYSFSNDPIPEDWLYSNNRINIVQQPSFPFEISNKIPRFRFSAYRTFIRDMKEIQPDIIHSHFNSYYTLLPYFLSKKIAAKFILTIHTNSVHYTSTSLINRILVRLESFAIKNAKMIVVPVSYDMHSYLLQSNLNLSEDFYKVIHNGIDSIFFSREVVSPASLDDLGITEEDILLINSARLEPVKNQEVIIYAMQEIVKTHPHIKLLCLGNTGSNFSYYSSLVTELKLENSVLFLGEKSDIASYLAKAHIGVFPSKSEGLSNALLEMMSMELPVILSDIPSFREVMEGMEYPLFVDVNDSNKLARYVIELVENENSRKEIGTMCRQQLIDKFTAKQMAQQYMELYQLPAPR